MLLIDFNKCLWDFYGLGYSALNISLPHKKIRQIICNIIKNLDQNQNILDAGCGTGTLLLELSQLNKKLKLIGIDFSNTMTFFAYLKIRLYKKKNIKIIKQSLTDNFPIHSGSIDTIISINTIFAIDKPKTTLSEFYRTLSKKGLLIIVTPLPNFSYWKLLKNHFSELLKLSLYKQIISTIFTLLALPLFVLIFLSNILITINEKLGKYSQYNKNKIINTLKDSGFAVNAIKRIVSGQEWIVYASKL